MLILTFDSITGLINVTCPRGEHKAPIQLCCNLRKIWFTIFPTACHNKIISYFIDTLHVTWNSDERPTAKLLPINIRADFPETYIVSPSSSFTFS
jgi:hypothetical protein